MQNITPSDHHEANPHAARPEFYRRRETARVLSTSESQVLKFERLGLLRVIQIPGIRAIRHVAAEVHALAQRWIAQASDTRNE